MARSTIRVRPPGEAWVTLGVEYGNGAVPEGESWSANEWGPDTGSFTIRRDARLPWVDLVPLSDVEVEAEGSGIVWGGRVWDVQYPTADTISVVCRGWQHALDDDMFERLYVKGGLDQFVDSRTVYNHQPNWGESANVGYTLDIGWPNPARLMIQYEAVGAQIDLGASICKSAYFDWINFTGRTTDTGLYLRGSNTPDLLVGSPTDAWYTASSSSVGASGTAGGDFGFAVRYIGIFLFVNVAGWTPATVPSLQVGDVRLFGETSYYNVSGFSDLLASQVVSDVRANMLPWASTDESQITTTATSILDLNTARMGGRYASPRQILQAANAYHDYLLGVDAEKRLYFRQRPTNPIIEIGEWAGAQVQDEGESAEELFNRVVVTYTGSDGVARTQVRTSTSPLLNRNGYTRSKVLTINSPVDDTTAQTIGDAWLATRVKRPMRGSVVVTGAGGARYVADRAVGAMVNPADLLRFPGQMLRLTHRWDPDDGAWGRDAYMTAVAWTPASDTATVTLESPRDRLDVLLGRLAATRDAGMPLA